MPATRKSRSDINHAQLGLVHLAVKQLGMDDTAYREMLMNVAGVNSASHLDAEGLDKIMDHLRTCGFVKTRGRNDRGRFVEYKQKWRAIGLRPGMATPGQLATIETIWDTLGSFWNKEGNGDRDNALRGFIQARYNVGDLRFLTDTQASKVIYAITAIKQRNNA